MIEIIPIGTKATTVQDSIPGMITACFIRHNSISYEFSYFLSGDYKSIVITEIEFTTDLQSKHKIGFKNG